MKPLLIRIPGVAVQLSFEQLMGETDYTTIMARARRKDEVRIEGEVVGAFNSVSPDVVRLIAANGPAVLEWLDAELAQAPSLSNPQPERPANDPRELRPIAPSYPRRSTVPCDNCGEQQVVQLTVTDLRCESCGWRTRIEKQ